MKDGTPQVGIFWRVRPPDADACLVVDCVPLKEAETYGDFLTYGSHYECWSKLEAMSPRDRQARLVPEAVRWTEYEEWPRGRVVFHRPSERFVLYADPTLQTPAIIDEITRYFALPADRTDVRSDTHYVVSR
jgi:hypothetical protein